MALPSRRGSARRVITRRALLLRVAVLGAAGLGLTSGVVRAQPTGVPVQPGSGGTLRIGKPEDIIPAGAPYVLLPGNIPLYNLVYNTLVHYDRQLQPQPELATAWS